MQSQEISRYKKGKKTILLYVVLTWAACRMDVQRDYPVTPVPFTSVRIEDHFWLPRMETNRTVTIPFAIQKNEETGRVNNFAVAAGRVEGRYAGRRFNDTDVYKVLEGAAYSLSLHPDPDLESYCDELIDLIAAAQEDDGYLYAARTADPDNPAPGAGPERWSHLRGSHELYNAGHMYEAAVAYYMATGRRKLLDVAEKNAGLLLDVFGPDKTRDFPGHQEVEMGLAKLYRTTGHSAYLELAKFFLDERGRGNERGCYPEDSPFALYNRKEYMQDHEPVLEQEEAVGHAVRACYMYSGMADVAALTGDADYVRSIDRIWNNVVSKKLDLTGGVGARHDTEAFGDDYELPNATAYAETCASIANVFWNHRQFLLHGDARYIDVMERVLYNALISGVSLSGDRFFYQNPLESEGGDERSPWFEVACCPGNLTRFLPSLPGYVYAQMEDVVYANLFVGSDAEIVIEGTPVRLEQKTGYPWEGAVTWTITPGRSLDFSFRIRIPGWARGRPVPSDLYTYAGESQEDVSLTVNGEATEIEMEKGYACVRRRWKKGDVVKLDLPMRVRRVRAHANVEEDRGKVALERGPIVYCAEWPDNDGRVLDLTLPADSRLESEPRPDMLGGIVAVKGTALRDAVEVDLVAIPYYAWAHRGPGEMTVWLKRQ